MAAAAKNPRSATTTTGRGREVLGIFLMAFGLFACLALVSMHTGSNRMMGPGGAATSAGLYALVGFGAYLLVFGMVAVALRCLRGLRLCDGPVEGAGAIGVLAGVSVLLHLPFAGRPHDLRGPGGVVGQWLGEVTASFVGAPGAALAATAVLSASLLLVTEIKMAEVVIVLGWALRHLGRAALVALRAFARVVRAALPERTDTSEAHALDGPEGFSDGPARVTEDAAPLVIGSEPVEPLPLIHGGPSEAVRIGLPLAESAEIEIEEDTAEPPLALAPGAPEPSAPQEARGLPPMAPIFAEIAAAEPAVAESILRAAGVLLDAAPADGESAPDESAVAADGAGPAQAAAGEPVPAPIIVEPPTRLLLRALEDEVVEAVDSPLRPAPVAAEPVIEEPFRKDPGPGFIKLAEGDFGLPSQDLLEYVPPPAHETDNQALYEMAARLEQAMATYKVKGKVREIHKGPVVHMYEFQPAPGTRVGAIMNLENDLAMALEVPAVRVAAIPGKGVVGVEVPNRTRETVYLKEILVDECFTGARSKLQVGLGKDIKGAPVSVNLAKMPHLLVAGTTGSGKSVTVNAMITSILCNATPDEVRFILVDPKMIEFSSYEGIPHLLLPVVTDPKKANLALRWAVDEMERRYETLVRAGVRDIATYNAHIDAAVEKAGHAGAVPSAIEETPSAKERAKRLRIMITAPDGTEQEVEIPADDDDGVVEAERADEVSAAVAAAQAARAEQPRKLPYIVIVIDEFADLMMVAAKDVETSVARIAQKARAAGLHLILATQRPSVDVITGLIKANFPSRIGLQVASRIDSRTILDQPGAETLLGNGDMLFSDRGTKLKRIHGAFLSEGEVRRVVEFLKTQGKPVYDMEILKPREEETDAAGQEGADDVDMEYFDRAVAFVCETRQVSVSGIQRRFQIGYNRAARLVEHMEKRGIVSPPNATKTREVLAPPGSYLQAGV